MAQEIKSRNPVGAPFMGAPKTSNKNGELTKGVTYPKQPDLNNAGHK